MDKQSTLDFLSEKWDKEIIPTLEEYITIPNVSPG